MGGHQRAGIAPGMRLLSDGRETAEELISVGMAVKDDGPVNASLHDVVEGAGASMRAVRGIPYGSVEN